MVIANGAECEPLVHVDQELMIERAGEVVQGLRAAMQATGAPRGILAVKQRYSRALAALRQAVAGSPEMTVFELGNFYPAGDEQVLRLRRDGPGGPRRRPPAQRGRCGAEHRDPAEYWRGSGGTAGGDQVPHDRRRRGAAR